jgi:hypothetical protein
MGSEASLILSLIFSSIGLGFFMYGKKGKKTTPLICGIGLMIYPYFIDNLYLTILVGIALCLPPFFIEI